MRNKQKLHFWLGMGLAGLLVLAAVIFLRPGRERIPIDFAFPLDGERLLVAGVSGDDTDTKRWSSIGVLEADGTMRVVVEQDSAIRVLGVAGGALWVDALEPGLHARALPGLDVVAAVSDAVASHRALSTRRQVLGLAEDGVVVSGSDSKRYRVAVDGTISEGKGIAAPVGGMVAQPSSGEAPVVTEARARTMLEQAEGITRPRLVMNHGRSGPLTLESPRSVLALSIEPDHGGSVELLHRIADGGSVVWSTSVVDLLDAVPTSSQHAQVVWVGELSGTLTALVQLRDFARSDSDADQGRSDQFLVTVDPTSGARSDARPVVTAG
ncbi:MAG: hypothetical protein AAF721_06440 [Myxococcota bacterium]